VTPVPNPERRSRTDALGPSALFAAAGVALLWSRATLGAVGSVRGWLVGATFGALLVGSLLVPVRERPVRSGMFLASATGAAVIGAWLLVLPDPVPLPATSLPLVFPLLGAAAEEAFFRRAAYGVLVARLPDRWATIGAVAVTAGAFAAIHLPLYGTAALPLDLGAGVLLSWQRATAGTWLVPLATHATLNLMAVAA
jgi:hypothetical protein